MIGYHRLFKGLGNLVNDIDIDRTMHFAHRGYVHLICLRIEATVASNLTSIGQGFSWYRLLLEVDKLLCFIIPTNSHVPCIWSFGIITQIGDAREMCELWMKGFYPTVIPRTDDALESLETPRKASIVLVSSFLSNSCSCVYMPKVRLLLRSLPPLP